MLTDDKEFYRSTLAIALPIALQNLAASSLNMVDTILIGGMGPQAIAAVGLANQVFFLFNLFLFGICSGASIFTSQFWGKKDIPNIRRVLGISLLSCVAIGLIFFVMAFFLPGPILRLFTKDAEVIKLGIGFLRIISFSYALTGVTFAYAFTLRGVGQPAYPMAVSMLAFGINTILNFLLIYGHWSLPRMGVSGSATATLIARAVEMAATLAIVYRLRLVPAAGIKELFSFTRLYVKRFYRTALPVIFNESLWALGTIMYTVVYAHMGTNIVAGFSIFSTVERLAMVLFFGLAQACAVIIGQKIGAGREDTAFSYAKRFSLLGPSLGILIGAVMVAASPSIMPFFKVPAAVTTLARQLTIVLACILPIRIFNLINIVGILRGGGDTRFSLFIDTAGLWLLAVPLVFLGGLVWHLPPILVYLLSASEEIFKFILGVWRLLSRRWINNLTHQMKDTSEGSAQAAENSIL